MALSLDAAFCAYECLVAATRTQPRDIGQIWYAARAGLNGRNPYAEIGPGLPFEWSSGLFYPLPAALAADGLAPLPYRLDF